MIRKCTESKQQMQKKPTALANAVLSKDVFRRILMSLQPKVFESCFVACLNSLRAASGDENENSKPITAVDEKTLKGNPERIRALGPVHPVSVWLTQSGLSLRQVATDRKCNEITVIPELLKPADIKGTGIRIDATGTQKSIAKQIVEPGGDYVLTFNGNQTRVQEVVLILVDAQLNNYFAVDKARRMEVEETKSGRQEIRTCIPFTLPNVLAGKSCTLPLRQKNLHFAKLLNDLLRQISFTRHLVPPHSGNQT